VFSEVTKNGKNKFEYKHKNDYISGLRQNKQKSLYNNLGIENKMPLKFVGNNVLILKRD
jgi:hypothetical protein